MKPRFRLLKLLCVILLVSLAFLVETTHAQADDTDQAPPSDDTAASTTCQDDASATTVFAPLGPPDEYMESSQPGIRLAVRRWEPPSTSDIMSVLVVHHGGIGWHSGYFDLLGTALSSSNSNIAVVAYDQVGSGYSDSMRGHRQFFDSMDTLTNDLHKVIAETKLKYKGKPVFALGESFGGMVLLHSMLRQQGGAKDDATAAGVANGYILTGPVIHLRDEMLPPKFVQTMVKAVAKFLPHLPAPGTDFMSTFDDAFGDEQWAAAGRADPFIQEAASTPPRLVMIASVLSASTNIWKSKHTIDAPFVIFMGQDDIRVNIPDSEELYRTALSTDKTLTIVPGGRHQLFQDKPNVTQSVLDGIQTWILARS